MIDPLTGPKALISSRHLLVAFACCLYVLSQALVTSVVAELRPSILELQLTFSVTGFWQILDAWGPVGQAAYRHHFLYDDIHPFVFGTAGYLVARLTPIFAHLPDRTRTYLTVCVPVAACFDLAENALQQILLNGAYGANSPLIPLSATCSLVKWTLALAFTVTLFIQFIRTLAQHRSRVD